MTTRDKLLKKIALATTVPEKGVKRFWRRLDHRARGALRARIHRNYANGIALKPSEVFDMAMHVEPQKALAYKREQLNLPAKATREQIMKAVWT